jgi:hypothetical protein
MDEKRAAYSLNAPGRVVSAPSLRLPGRSPFPGVDDHLVQPEVTRDEVIGGRRMVASPAETPHATRHTDLDYLVRAHVAPGFTTAADLITRFDEDSDFATDVAVFRSGIDPETGNRYLEEIAFEVVSRQNRGIVGEKAVRMHRRGVRRIFTVWLKKQQVCEWSSESRSWRPLETGAQIEDPCLVKPLAVAALLDAALADDAVVEALVAKSNPVILKREAAAEARGEVRGEARGEARGRAEGLAAALLEILDERGVAVSTGQRQEILGCHDLERLNRWLRRAIRASSVDEITSEA